MKLNSSTLDPANQKWSSTPQGLRVFEPLPMKKIMIGQMVSNFDSSSLPREKNVPRGEVYSHGMSKSHAFDLSF